MVTNLPWAFNITFTLSSVLTLKEWERQFFLGVRTVRVELGLRWWETGKTPSPTSTRMCIVASSWGYKKRLMGIAFSLLRPCGVVRNKNNILKGKAFVGCPSWIYLTIFYIYFKIFIMIFGRFMGFYIKLVIPTSLTGFIHNGFK